MVLCLVLDDAELAMCNVCEDIAVFFELTPAADHVGCSSSATCR